MSLAEKLLKVMTDCASVVKDGYNKHYDYRYITAAKVNDIVNAALVNHGIVTTSEATLLESVDVSTGSGKRERLATVKVEITLHDKDSEETMTISGIGSGQDATDKGVAKAQTMAVKYAWKSALLIADASDDPDSDSTTTTSDSATTFVQTDRPGGTPIGKTAANGWSGDGKKIVGKCEKCGRDVNEKSAYYSHRSFGEHLYCYNCQQELRNSKAEAADVPF